MLANAIRAATETSASARSAAGSIDSSRRTSLTTTALPVSRCAARHDSPSGPSPSFAWISNAPTTVPIMSIDDITCDIVIR